MTTNLLQLIGKKLEPPTASNVHPLKCETVQGLRHTPALSGKRFKFSSVHLLKCETPWLQMLKPKTPWHRPQVRRTVHIFDLPDATRRRL